MQGCVGALVGGDAEMGLQGCVLRAEGCWLLSIASMVLLRLYFAEISLKCGSAAVEHQHDPDAHAPRGGARATASHFRKYNYCIKVCTKLRKMQGIQS